MLLKNGIKRAELAAALFKQLNRALRQIKSNFFQRRESALRSRDNGKIAEEDDISKINKRFISN